MDKIPKSSAVYGQLDRASTSIPLNIAEGNGKRTQLDRCKFFYISRGSAFECAAALDVLVAKNILMQDEIQAGKEILLKTVSMLIKLIDSNMSGTIREEIAEYGWDDDDKS
jgi:four helix bundle protein